MIARLSKELTAAREALSTLKPQALHGNKEAGAGDVGDVEMEQSVDENQGDFECIYFYIAILFRYL